MHGQPTHTCTFFTNQHTPLSQPIAIQDSLSLVNASRTGEQTTVTSLLDSGADPHFEDIVRKICDYRPTAHIASVLGIGYDGTYMYMQQCIFSISLFSMMRLLYTRPVVQVRVQSSHYY